MRAASKVSLKRLNSPWSRLQYTFSGLSLVHTDLIEVYVRNSVHWDHFYRSTVLQFKSQVTGDLFIDFIMLGMVLNF